MCNKLNKEKKYQKTLILFDMGGVLLKLDYNTFYRKVASISKTMSESNFKEKYIKSGIELLALKGKIPTSIFINKLKIIIRPTKQLSYKDVKNIFQHCWGKPINEMIKLKQQLYEAGYVVGVFSNITKLAHELINKEYPEIFETYNRRAPRIYSYKIGSIKPEPQIYQTIKGYKNIIFIDDNKNYLQVAITQFGWKGILFTPFTDKAEAIRSVHNNKISSKASFRIANSLTSLKNHLQEFGINFSR